MEGTTVTRHHDLVSVRVVEAVADAENTDPLDLRPPLYDAIDPTALDQLCQSGTAASIEFMYHGHTVAVSSDGTISVDGQIHQ